MEKKQIVLITLLVLLVSGCRSIPYDRGSFIEDKKLLALLIAKGKKLYPKSFQAVHRTILRVREREFVFEGYVLVKRPDRIRMLVKGSMGTTAFDVAQAKGDISILQNPANLQPSWIMGALRDVSALYLISWWDKGVLVRHKSGAVGLAHDRPDDTREEFVFDGVNYQLTHYFRAREGDCLYKIEFSGVSEATKTIKITDYDLDYHLTIQVIQLEESELDDKLFESNP